MSEKFEKKILGSKHFNAFAWLVIIIGVALWLFVLFRVFHIARASATVPVVGSSDMLLRAQAINDALSRGETTYSYESAQGPAPLQTNKEEK